MMKRLIALLSATALAGCASADDAPRLTKLADGGYEWAIPQTFGNTATTSRVLFYNSTWLQRKAQEVCPSGYQLTDHGVRKRPEYADPDKVWRIECQ
jgi:hypothetical protein